FLDPSRRLPHLHAFPTRRSSDLEGRPYLDGIEISVIGDSQPQESAFISHQVNITQPWFGFDSFEAGEALAAATPDDVVVDHRTRSEEHTSELQSRENLVCRLLLE